MASHARVSRRAAARAIGALGLAVAGCASSRPAARTGRTSTTAPSSPRGGSAAAADDDAELRKRAVTDEHRLLAACAAPAGQEPFATLRRVHRDHLQMLTGQQPTLPSPAALAPVSASLASAERAVATVRRSDCVRASAALAPILAGLAASAEVAVALLAPTA